MLFVCNVQAIFFNYRTITMHINYPHLVKGVLLVCFYVSLLFNTTLVHAQNNEAKDSSAVVAEVPDSTLSDYLAAYKGREDDGELNLKIAMEYYFEEDPSLGIPYGLKAQKLLPNNADPYYYTGALYYIIGDHDQAIEMMYRAIEIEPLDDFYSMLNISRLKRNTDRSVMDVNGRDFKDLHSFNLEAMKLQVTDEASLYYFPKLMKKYMADHTTLSIDEYFMLYFGQVAQADYSPYFSPIDDEVKQLKELYGKEEYEKAVEIGAKLYAKVPLNIDLNWYLGACYYKLDQYDKYDRHMGTYRSLLYAIASTGNGKTPETAYIVAAVSDEYELMTYLNYRTSMQSLVHRDGHSFDVQKCTDGKGDEEFDVYFNIDMPWRSLSSMFDLSDADKLTKGKKGKKKKKKSKGE